MIVEELSDLPALFVDGDRQRLLMVGMVDTVRIDGPLPTVWERCRDPECHCNGGFIGHPLRAGDRVTLATEHVKHYKHGRTERTFPFATAEVVSAHQGDSGVWAITVTDVEELS